MLSAHYGTARRFDQKCWNAAAFEQSQFFDHTGYASFHELYTRPRHEHRDPTTVLLILLAEQLDHIPLFQSDSNQNVGRRHHGEQKVSRGHCWRRPECDDEAEIDRVPYDLV